MARSWRSPGGDSPGLLAEAWRTLRLAWRLLRDERVPAAIKALIPVLGLLYLLLPIDIAPDLMPVLGQLDDLAILLLLARLLIELSPPAVVADHEADLSNRHADMVDPSPDNVVDARRYRVMDE